MVTDNLYSFMKFARYEIRRDHVDNMRFLPIPVRHKRDSKNLYRLKTQSITHTFQQSFEIPKREQPSHFRITRLQIVFSHQSRRVVNANRAIETHLFIGPDGFQHIGLSIIVKCFGKAFCSTPDVAKMDVE